MELRRRTRAEERTSLSQDEAVSPSPPHRQTTLPMRRFLSYKDEATLRGEEAEGRLEP